MASALVTVSGWGRQRTVATAVGDRKAPEKWVGRLTLEPREAAVIASAGSGTNGHNGTNGHGLNGVNGHNGNGANGHNGTCERPQRPNGHAVEAVNGPNANGTNGHIAHTDDDADDHDGNGIAASYQNGHMVIAEEEDVVTSPDEEALTG